MNFLAKAKKPSKTDIKTKKAPKGSKKSIPVTDFDIYDEYAKAKPSTTIKEAAAKSKILVL